MTLTINAPAVESRLQQEAAQQGLSVEEYALRLLEAHLGHEEHSVQQKVIGQGQEPKALPLQQKTSSEAWLLRFRAWVESHGDFPTLPPQSFERASFYEGRP